MVCLSVRPSSLLASSRLAISLVAFGRISRNWEALVRRAKSLLRSFSGRAAVAARAASRPRLGGRAVDVQPNPQRMARLVLEHVELVVLDVDLAHLQDVRRWLAGTVGQVHRVAQRLAAGACTASQTSASASRGALLFFRTPRHGLSFWVKPYSRAMLKTWERRAISRFARTGADRASR
jgi:hypothetical protein